MDQGNIGLYIHIPFCQAKCDYCDFLSFSNKQDQWEAYINSLIYTELPLFEPYSPIDTIYIGGGTPTVLPVFLLQKLLKAIPSYLPNTEITCEANPGTLSEEKIAALANGGVNRISLGLQSWQDHLLQNIGRCTTHGHYQKIFEDNFHLLRRAGFNNINVDIMFALPNQTLANWEETLEKVIDLQPEHISAYGLTLEEGTPLELRLKNEHNKYAKESYEELNEELDRQMYHRCKSFLQDKGYIQYELSNFCKSGYESQHNIKYWTRKPYIGLGLGSHSFNGNIRWSNTTDLQQYLAADHMEDIYDTHSRYSDIITKTDAMAEFMFLGLRMTKGVSEKNFIQNFGQSIFEVYGSWIAKMIDDRLLQKHDDHIALTNLGMDLANQVMAGFLQNI
ncbi:MAG: radical SAM family heme chaperone HemW [Defluviitaleaceae bacterium]|nr:radical SAM family heme chaperone HemW [Defluviitaleaceae bacterium]